MADLSFHHGVRVFESGETPALFRIDQTAVVIVYGTAPNADPILWPYNEPVLLKGSAAQALSLGVAGTLKSAIDGIFDQHGAYVFVVRVEEGGTPAETLSNLVGDQAAMTGVWAALKCEPKFALKPRIAIVPGFTASTPADGIASITIANQGVGYQSTPTITLTGGNGAGATAEAVFADGKVTGAIIRRAGAGYTLAPAVVISGGGSGAAATATLTGGAVTAIAVTQGGAGYVTPPAVTITGDGEGAEAVAVLAGGVVTAITVTEGGGDYTEATVSIAGGSLAAGVAVIGNVANPVVAELDAVLSRVRAVAFVDGPDTTDEAAVAYRGLLNSQRIYVIDPKVLVWDTQEDAYVPQPASPRFAGVQCMVDRTLGFWWSVSNKPIKGIGGVTRPVTYGDQANYLNERAVNTIINRSGTGFRTWGNRVATADSLWRFLPVRRTADFINEAIEETYLEFVDRPFSLANLKHLLESGRAGMRTLQNNGAILGGNVWAPSDMNTDAQMAAGIYYVAVDFEPPAPMEDIRVPAYRNISYYAVLRDRALTEIADGSLTGAAA
ncbi:MAG: phage tail sheath subtilisin-like domain-containing protein [Pseudomonadota bacterium]